MATTARRPGLVTVLVVLVVIAGLLSLLAGIIALGASGGTPAAIAILVLGLLYLAVAKGLADGRNWARIVTGVVAAVQVIFAVMALVNSSGSTNQGSAVGSGVVGLAILAILWSPRANAFFGSRALDSRPV